MPLSRLENFLRNTDGNILYVNPSDLDATDSIENQGNSLTRPFKTIQRALLEAARFSYNIGLNNDRFDRTTILVYPGVNYIDNRPGYVVASGGNSFLELDPNLSPLTTPAYTAASLSELSSSSNFDIFSPTNDLYKYNSSSGGVILPRGTSIIGLDLRKTKIRPLFVPDPENDLIARSSIFRITGGCYIREFTIFDGDPNGTVYKNYKTDLVTPSFSHHKLTAFEYADGANPLSRVSIGSTTSTFTELQMYYIKVQKAYGESSGRAIGDFPATADLEVINPEFRIVGAVSPTDIGIGSVTAIGNLATIDTTTAHGVIVDDPINVAGISSNLYNGSFTVAGVTSERRFSYRLTATPANLGPSLTGSAKVVLEIDTVSGASPYLFNISLRSTFGMCGLHADGSKVSGFKSVVVAQYTGIGLQKDDNAFVLYDQSTGSYKTESQISDASLKPLHLNTNAVYSPDYENFHIKVSNNSYIQAVSVFAIGFANQFLTESGGDLGITNSNSNFGSKSLISKGFRPDAFTSDNTGYITHVIPPRDETPDNTAVSCFSLNVGLTTNPVGGATTSKLYIFGFNDVDVTPNENVSGFRIGSKDSDTFNVEVNEVAVTTPILMPIPGSGDGPSARKVFTVSRSNNANVISSNILTLTSSHNFFNGESVRLISDDGNVPDGLVNEELYFVITNAIDGSLTANTIKLAATFNDATVGTPFPVVITSTIGGVLTIESRVTDKTPGELGHPIQFDTTNSNWYIVGSGTTIQNKINQSFITNRSSLGDQSGVGFILRKSDNRLLNDRIYRLRYIIPKEFVNAKEPSVSYILQESSTVGVSSALEYGAVGDTTKQRNVKIIADAVYGSNIITFTTEKPHGFNISDSVTVNKVISSDNPTGVGQSGYNETYTITSVPTTKTFKVTTAKTLGAFGNEISSRDVNLPTVARSQYRNTYLISSVDTIQLYVSGQKDGIYHLICLDGSISPSTSDGVFNSEKLHQNLGNLYPTIDRDNYNSDPTIARSFAVPYNVGEIIVSDSRDSITKESSVNYYKDNRIGFGITNATSNASGITTVFTNIEHNLNTITTLSITAAGTGYGAGIATFLYNVPLVGTGITGDGATAKVRVSAIGAVTAVEIIDGGSAYGVGNTMRVGAGGNAIVSVTAINSNIGSVIEVVGVGTTANRFNSGYNGVYQITGINSTRSVTYQVQNGANTGINAGIFTSVNGYEGLLFVSDRAVGVSTIGYGNSSVGIVTVTTQSAHGLILGNKFKIVGAAQTIYNGTYVVRERVGLNTFSFQIGAGTSNPAFTTNSGVFVLKQSFASQKSEFEDNSEKIAGRLTPFYAGLSTTLGGSQTGTATTIKLTSLTGISTGDYLQIDNEIVRISDGLDASTGVANVLRGALGTKAESHENTAIAREVKPVATELRRYSTIRASGHTFEYLGFGPGNYSVGLPQRQSRILTIKNQLLSQGKQSDGGSVAYTGMNDTGDFYIGNKRISSTNGEEETLNAPIQNFLGEEISSLSVNFDDVTIKNSLTVQGGTTGRVVSEFKGPVNFLKKVTFSDADFIRIKLKGALSQSRSVSYGTNNIPSTSPDTQGDIFFNGNATSGQYAGWINSGNSANDWKRFGLISRSATETFVTPDRIGINSAGPLRGLPSVGITTALLDVRGGGVFDSLRVIGNVDFENGATFASISFVDVFVSGIGSFTGTTDSTNVTTGIVTVAGGVGIKKSLNVGAGLSVSGVGTFAQNLNVGAGLSVSGVGTFAQNLKVGAGLNVGGNFKLSGISTFVGNVTFEGGTISLGDANTDNVVFTADVNSNILPNTNDTFDIGDASTSKRWRHASFSGVGTFGSVNITSATQSTSKDTGCLILEGGLGVEQNVNINGMLNVTGITTLSSGALIIGDTTESISKDTGCLILQGGIGVEKNANIGGGLNVNNLTATNGNFTGIVTTGNLTATGIVSDSYGNLRDIPQNSQSSTYSLQITDAGKHISITTGGVTVPSSVFSAGDAVTIFNNSSVNQTITQGSGVTLRFSGTVLTGNRTLLPYGIATVLCVSSDIFAIVGIVT
jgi:hypothetical protein